MQLQLARDDFSVLLRMFVRREIDEMHENRAALDMAEELVAQTMSLMCSLDQSGNVGDDDRLIVIRLDDAEVRDERGEGIVGDLRLRRADRRDQRRFAGVRESDDTDVSDEFELDGQLALLAVVARLS